jgi:zinc-ribbon domain
MSDTLDLAGGDRRNDHEVRQLDEQRISRWIALGLPLVTLSVALGVGVVIGPATSILVLAAGLLLGVIALLWGSLRILSGDAPLSPELEALDMAAQGVDALAGRKKMLLRALKDLDNERAIGKLEDDDYEQLSFTYREDLKLVLKHIDESLAPHRARAEEAAREHLLKVGLGERSRQDAIEPERSKRGESSREGKPTQTAREKATVDASLTNDARVVCPKCGESNERDAKFCKECATRLSGAAATAGEAKAAASETEESDDE